ncbi:MAG: hypothetical protein ACI9MC_004068, partial [Kiritimatiellia bacterium]
MLDAESVSEMLELVSDPTLARKRSKDISCLRGIRGTPNRELAQATSAAWLESRPKLPRDEDDLSTLFMTAWEDGMVAIGLLAALVPDSPQDVLDIGRDWAERMDDRVTADTLGWMVLGPASLACGEPPHQSLGAMLQHRRPEVRRAAVMAGLALLPESLSGPSAAALRTRLGVSEIRFVAEPLSPWLNELATACWRDDNPAVRKATRRVLSAWALHDPDAATEWMSHVKGGLPKMLRDGMEKSARKGRRRKTE